MNDPPPMPQPVSARHLPPQEFHRWYGGWEPLDPTSVGGFMEGFDRPWWIIGGWTIEKFTGVTRVHEDMDISMFSSDAEAFRQFLGDRWTPWTMDDGWLRPFDDRFRDIRPTSSIWVRPHARAAWILDVPLTPATDGLWTNKKLPNHTAPLSEVTWEAEDGLRYLRPELTLLMKAALAREKDRADAAAALPRLDRSQGRRLRSLLQELHPHHPWLRQLEG